MCGPMLLLIKAVCEEQTRFDQEAEPFHRRVQEGFRLLARAHPDRIKVVDALRSPQQVHREIVELVQPLVRR